MIASKSTGRPRYYSYNSICSKENELDVIDLAKRRYNRAIRIFRQCINRVISHSYNSTPVYKDKDVSSIMSVIKQNKNLPKKKLAIIVYQFIINLES